MGASRIEQLIEDIYEFIESCKMSPLSSTKVIVPKDELYDLLDELRLRTPDEIKRYQKIISNRDAIIADAEEKAAVIIAEAGQKANSLINGHEIMQQAYDQANAMVSNAAVEANKMIETANEDAHQIRVAALNYTGEMLLDAENIMSNALESTKTKYESLINSLKGNLDIIANNKKELNQQTTGNSANPKIDELLEEELLENEYDFDEDTFLENID